MVISRFADFNPVENYINTRRARLDEQVLRTQQAAMERRRAAFNQMLGQIEDPQQRLALEVGGVEGVPAFFEGQRRAQAAQEAAAAEAEAARRAQVQQYGMGVATRRRQLAQQEGFNEDEFLRQAYDFGRSEYGMQMPYEQFVERARNPMAGEMPEEQTTAFRTRDALARAGGLEPGTREYEEFMLGEQTSPIDVLTLALAERMAPTPPVNDDVVGRGLTNQQIQVSGVVQDLQSIRETYNPQFTEIPTRVLQAAGALGERLGIESSPEEQALARQYFAWRANSSRTLNNYVRAMTGAQVAVAEFPRMAQVVPYAGTGILDGDSASQFGAKLEAFEQATALAMFRYNYLLRDANIDPQFQEREIQLPGGDTETRLVATNPQFLELQRQYGIFGDNVPATRNLMRSRLESIAQQVDQEMPDSSEAERDREALRRFTTRYAISPAMALSVME